MAFTYNYIVKNGMMTMAIATVGIKEARALAPDVVQITCSKPKADMMHIFLPILPRHVWEKVDPQKAQTSYVNKPPIVGTGPFITTEFKKGSFVKMERNPYYWGARPALDQLFFLFLHQRRHHDRRPQVGRDRRRLGDPGGAVRLSRLGAGHPARGLQLLQLGLPLDELLRGQVAGEPGAPG